MRQIETSSGNLHLKNIKKSSVFFKNDEKNIRRKQMSYLLKNKSENIKINFKMNNFKSEFIALHL